MLIPWQLINSFNFKGLRRFFQLFILRLRRLRLFILLSWPLRDLTPSIGLWNIEQFQCEHDLLFWWRVSFSSHGFLLHLTSSSLAQNVFICLYGLFLIVTIPEFKEALRLCCAVRWEIKDSEGNTGRVNMAKPKSKLMYNSLLNRKLWRIHNCDPEGVRASPVSFRYLVCCSRSNK